MSTANRFLQLDTSSSLLLVSLTFPTLALIKRIAVHREPPKSTEVHYTLYVLELVIC